MAQEFNISRIGQFIRRDLTILKGTFVTGLLVGIILIFLFCFFNMIGDKNLASDEFLGIFGLVYIPMGILFTFSIFKEFNNSKSNHFYLALPISIPERLVAKWLTTTVIYTLMISLLSVVTGVLAIMFGAIVFGADFLTCYPFSQNNIGTW